MSLPAQVIAHYERLSWMAGQMLKAAREEEWDLLISMEQQYRDLVSVIRPLDTEAVLGEDDRQYKKQLINSILADDIEIQHHVQAWMRQLQLSIQSNRQEQRLLQAYGA